MNKPSPSLHWWLLRYLRPEWPALSTGGAIMSARAMVLLLLPWPLKAIVDNVIFQHPLGPFLAGFLPSPLTHRMLLLDTLGLAMLGLGALDALLVYLGSRLLLDTGQRIMFAIRFDLFAHLQRLSRATTLAFALALAATLTGGAALADPWIPAAGNGVIKPEIRLYSADHHFSASNFGTATTPASKLNLNLFRVSGVAGLGYNLSLEYDLRFAQARLSHLGATHTSTGVQDQELGLNYGLTQTRTFANSLTFNVIFPTGAPKPAPALGTGRWAVEPDAQFGLHQGRFTATLIAGPRVFLDGGATQLRAELDLSARATQRLSFTGSLFYVSTIQQQHPLPLASQGELYNLLRLGVGARYRLTPALRPFIEYDSDIAGKGIHAGQRIIAGIAIDY